ncbi:MAG: hypothetical protein IKW30_08605 [Lachnospiraceae bacterium]|nr:hypothetical protein [Lachnospiraceae bacterium]
MFDTVQNPLLADGKFISLGEYHYMSLFGKYSTVEELKDTHLDSEDLVLGTVMF